MFQAAGEIAQEPLGLVRVALVPGLAQGLADARVQALVQPVCDVAPLVHLATLDQRRMPEAPPDRLGERLGAVDDVEPGALGIEAAIDQVVEQGLHRGRVLRRALGQAQHVLLAARVDTDRRHHHVIADMKPVDLDDQKIQFLQPARQPSLQLRPRQGHEAARDRRLRTPVPAADGRSPPASAGRRTARPYLRVETFITIRFIAQACSSSGSDISSKLGKLSSPPPGSRTRGRSSFTLALEGQLARGRAPAMAPALGRAGMTRAAHGLRVRRQHLGQRLDAGQKAEAIDAHAKILVGIR